MPDRPRTPVPERPRMVGPLTARLALAFPAVAMGGLALPTAPSGPGAAGAGGAALLALGMAIVVSRRITRPVLALTETARAVESGDETARVGNIRAPGELGTLAIAFDRMADSLALQDAL